jgi:hypothetical protein
MTISTGRVRESFTDLYLRRLNANCAYQTNWRDFVSSRPGMPGHYTGGHLAHR